MLCIEDLANEVHKRFLILRSIDRTIITPTFKTLFAKASESDKLKVQELINAIDGEGFESWIKRQAQAEYSAMTVRDLRKLGQRLGIPYYNQITRPQLLSEITKHESAKESSNGRIDGPGQDSCKHSRLASSDAL